MGVDKKDVKSWFAEERKAKGHAGSGSTPPRERPSSVEIRARLPMTTRGSRPSASYVPKRAEEYMEDDDTMKTDADPLWPDTPGLNITLYAYDSKNHEPTEFAILDASALYDTGDVESQDSRFEHASAMEVDIKEHVIDPTEETRPAVLGLSFDEPPPSHRARSKGEPVKLSSRDPRQRRVSLASPVILYGRTAAPMVYPSNVAQGTLDVIQLQDLSMDAMASDGEDNLVIDVNME